MGFDKMVSQNKSNMRDGVASCALLGWGQMVRGKAA